MIIAHASCFPDPLTEGHDVRAVVHRTREWLKTRRGLSVTISQHKFSDDGRWSIDKYRLVAIGENRTGEVEIKWYINTDKVQQYENRYCLERVI